MRCTEQAVIGLPGWMGVNDCERCFLTGNFGGMSRSTCNGGDDLGLPDKENRQIDILIFRCSQQQTSHFVMKTICAENRHFLRALNCILQLAISINLQLDTFDEPRGSMKSMLDEKNS